jgi:hypothetical protein
MEVIYLRDLTNLARGWVTDEVTLDIGRERTNREEEEAIAGRLHYDGSRVVNPEDGHGLEPGLRGSGPLVEGAEVAPWALAFGEEDEVEGGLVAVVCQEEVAGRGEAAPGTTDGPAAQEVLGGQAHEDLQGEDLLREADAKRIRLCYWEPRHGRRRNAQLALLLDYFPGRRGMEVEEEVTAYQWTCLPTVTAGDSARRQRQQAGGARGEAARGRRAEAGAAATREFRRKRGR